MSVTTALHRVAASTIYNFIMSRANERGRMPFAADSSLVHASGPDADRILILGGPVILGMGVTSHELGVAGSVARGLARITGRGADVAAQGFVSFDLERCVTELQRVDLGRFDGVILQVGSRELLSLTPIGAWSGGVHAITRVLAERKPPGLPVMILSTLPVSESINAPAWARRIMNALVPRMNEVLRDACETSGVARYVELRPDPERSDFARDARHIYQRWADDIVPALAAAMDEAKPRSVSPVNEMERQQALENLHISHESDARVDRIVKMARDTFGVHSASLTVIDRDIQWIKSAVGMPDDSIAREDAFCNTTIATEGVFVVEDLAADEAFASLPWVGGDDGQRFYAGYPLEAPGGQRIGALCVLDTAPRHFSRDDASMLRDLALSAQAVLWEAAEAS
ncbi:hypothetical protein BH11ACT3_BH11ACT3_17880 [soil metagenome]